MPLTAALRNQFEAHAPFALTLDVADPLRAARDEFFIPSGPDGHPVVYLCGNSLGLQPRAVHAAIHKHLDDWARLAVESHFHGHDPWKLYHKAFAEPLARLAGAKPVEVVAMNGLTVNLHLLMTSFYRPTGRRTKIVIEDTAFPSDSYAVASQARLHGFDPATTILRLKPRPGEHTLHTEDILATIREHGPDLALVMLGAVNYLTGQWFDMPAITAAAHDAGAIVGWDCAHAIGNVPLKLHDINADFAVWCSYKYLNSGPGAIAGAFVHERHARSFELPRLAGWWGHDEATRFKMGPDFSPSIGADGWQIANPPIFSAVPLRVSLDLFDRFGIAALREKSIKLTAYAQWWIEHLNHRAAQSAASSGGPPAITILTPSDPSRRGCQLSLTVAQDPRAFHSALNAAGVMCDFREPNVVRIAPTPLYNSYHDIYRFGHTLANHLHLQP